MIALVDCNNFYVSCERLFNPALAGKPVVVLSNNDGCVIARSEEAKLIGIEMGAPSFMMEDFLCKHNVQVFSSNYALYGNLSERVQAVLHTFTPCSECYSIDEAFLDLSGVRDNELFDYGIAIRRAVGQQVGLPVSVGIAATKTLAKMANRFAKKNRTTAGVYCLDNEIKQREVLEWTSVDEVWGIGAQHGRRLKWMGIKSAADFIDQLSPEWIRKQMSVVGERLFNELKGIPAIEWQSGFHPKKGIATARSFGKLLSAEKDIQEAVANFAASCALKLRKQHSCATTLQVLLQTNVHRLEDPQYSRSITLPLPVPTNSSSEIIAYAIKALKMIYRPGYRFKKAGVTVRDIVPEQQSQQSLFDKICRSRDHQVMKAMDVLNQRFGKDSIRFAVQGYSRNWQLRQHKLSPSYCTDINQILTVNI